MPVEKTVTVNGKDVATDLLIIFDRLVFAAEQDSSLKLGGKLEIRAVSHAVDFV